MLISSFYDNTFRTVYHKNTKTNKIILSFYELLKTQISFM